MKTTTKVKKLEYDVDIVKAYSGQILVGHFLNPDSLLLEIFRTSQKNLRREHHYHLERRRIRDVGIIDSCVVLGSSSLVEFLDLSNAQCVHSMPIDEDEGTVAHILTFESICACVLTSNKVYLFENHTLLRVIEPNELVSFQSASLWQLPNHLLSGHEQPELSIIICGNPFVQCYRNIKNDSRKSSNGFFNATKTVAKDALKGILRKFWDSSDAKPQQHIEVFKFDPDFFLIEKGKVGVQVVLSPNGLFASISDSHGRVTLFDLRNQYVLQILKGYRGVQMQWRLSNSTEELLLYMKVSGTLDVWCLCDWFLELKGRFNTIRDAVLLPHGLLLLLLRERELYLIDLDKETNNEEAILETLRRIKESYRLLETRDSNYNAGKWLLQMLCTDPSFIEAIRITSSQYPVRDLIITYIVDSSIPIDHYVVNAFIALIRSCDTEEDRELFSELLLRREKEWMGHERKLLRWVALATSTNDKLPPEADIPGKPQFVVPVGHSACKDALASSVEVLECCARRNELSSSFFQSLHSSEKTICALLGACKRKDMRMIARFRFSGKPLYRYLVIAGLWTNRHDPPICDLLITLFDECEKITAEMISEFLPTTSFLLQDKKMCEMIANLKVLTEDFMKQCLLYLHFVQKLLQLADHNLINRFEICLLPQLRNAFCLEATVSHDTIDSLEKVAICQELCKRGICGEADAVVKLLSCFEPIDTDLLLRNLNHSSV